VTGFGPSLTGGLLRLDLKEKEKRGCGPGLKGKWSRVGLKEKGERKLEGESLRGFLRHELLNFLKTTQ
jgi:hypothetical protein